MEDGIGGVVGELLYFPGDLVTVAGNNHKCILKHEANQTQKPSLDS